MSRTAEQAVQAMRDALGHGQLTFTGVVKSVNEDDATCVVTIYEDFDVEDVQLKALKEVSTGVVIIPKVDSPVLIMNIGRPDFYVLDVAEVDKVKVTAGSITLQLTEDGIVLNDGKNDGVPIAGKVADRLNKIEQDLNTLKQVFLTDWIVVANDGGAALKGAAAAWAGQQLTTTTKGQIANTKVTH